MIRVPLRDNDLPSAPVKRHQDNITRTRDQGVSLLFLDLNDPPVVFDVTVPCDHVPEDTAVLRFSGAVKTIDTMNTDFVTVRLFEFTANPGG